MESYITANEILDYTYCKRRWYLHSIEKQNNKQDILLTEGAIIHDKLTNNNMIHLTNKIIIDNYHMYNKNLKIYGICDKIELEESPFGINISLWDKPVLIKLIEIKHGKKRDCLEYKLQLMAYVVCFEYMFNCSLKSALIYFFEDDSYQEVECSEQLRHQLLTTINEINIEKENIKSPKFKYQKRCLSCSMLDICRPRELKIQNYLSDLW